MAVNRMTEPDVPALAAQIACRLLADYEPSDRTADDQIARRAVRLARLLIAEVARTETELKTFREAGRS